MLHSACRVQPTAPSLVHRRARVPKSVKVHRARPDVEQCGAIYLQLAERSSGLQGRRHEVRIVTILRISSPDLGQHRPHILVIVAAVENNAPLASTASWSSPASGTMPLRRRALSAHAHMSCAMRGAVPRQHATVDKREGCAIHIRCNSVGPLGLLIVSIIVTFASRRFSSGRPSNKCRASVRCVSNRSN